MEITSTSDASALYIRDTRQTRRLNLHGDFVSRESASGIVWLTSSSRVLHRTVDFILPEPRPFAFHRLIYIWILFAGFPIPLIRLAHDDNRRVVQDDQLFPRDRLSARVSPEIFYPLNFLSLSSSSYAYHRLGFPIAANASYGLFRLISRSLIAPFRRHNRDPNGLLSVLRYIKDERSLRCLRDEKELSYGSYQLLFLVLYFT